MRVEQVDPYDINVDDMNERRDNVNTTDLQASIAEQGVVEPPIVRVRDEDASVPYSVIVGQRRTIAAQAVGLESIPVVIRDLDDGDALEASITENVDAFQEKVSAKDRALAIERLKKINGWSNQQVGDSIGVTKRTVTDWLEYTRDEWEGTSIHPDDSEECASARTLEKDEQTATNVVTKVRRMTGGGEEGEQLLQKIESEGLSQHDVQEVKSRVDAGKDPEVAVKEVSNEKEEAKDTVMKVFVEGTFTGKEAAGLKAVSQNLGLSNNEVMKRAVTDFLKERGEL